MANWNRPRSDVDLAVLDTDKRVDLVTELKVWDIGHQLFDLVKVCCLLAAGANTAYLICVARRDGDFDRLPGGELFPSEVGTASHDMVDLIATHADEWSRHVGNGGPEPTSMPTRVTTQSVATGVSMDAYPGHSARAARVEVTDATPIRLLDGWPQSVRELLVDEAPAGHAGTSTVRGLTSSGSG